MLAEAHRQAAEDIEKTIPAWLERVTRTLIKDIIGLLIERHPDLRAVILYARGSLPAPFAA